MTISLFAALGLLAVTGGVVGKEETISLWPGAAPGDSGDLGVEHDSTKQSPNGGPEDGVIRLANVTKPTITVYRPNKAIDTGVAVVVCPGGGYSILAMNLEGTEICQWLNSIGVTGILLKYRVPIRKGRPRFEPPLQDAQRALGIVRQHATGWVSLCKLSGVILCALFGVTSLCGPTGNVVGRSKRAGARSIPLVASTH